MVNQVILTRERLNLNLGTRVRNTLAVKNKNMRWLTTIIAENADAADLAKRAAVAASDLAIKNLPGNSVVSSDFACPGWVPAEGFGINGSYGYSLRVNVVNNRIEDRDLMVTLTGAVSNLGSVEVSGKAEFFVEGHEKPFTEIALSHAWFPTIGSPGSVSVFGKRGSSVALPSGKQVSIRITLNPIVVTSSGAVALWPCTRTLPLP